MRDKFKLGLLHLFFWLIFVILFTVAFDNILPFDISLLRAVANVCLMAILFYLNFWLVDRCLERQSYFTYLLLVLVCLASFSLLRAVVNSFFPEIRIQGRTFNLSKAFWITSVAINLSVMMMSTIYQILKRRFENERRNLAIINRQKEAQLQFLKGQINPHFLFNTLNNIYSLAVMRSEKTPKMVLQLSKLLRYVIYESKEERVPLDKEVEQLKRFIDLYRLRSEREPEIRFRYDKKLNGKMIEPMVLIPLVENCFKHSDMAENPKGYLHIDLKLEGQRLIFRTMNTKNPYDNQKDAIGGVGLENILQRLELKYPGQYTLVTKDRLDEFEVLFTLNLIHGNH